MSRVLQMAAFLAISLLVPAPVFAEVYKYVDENGLVNYTNIKPEGVRDYTTFSFPCYASDPKCRDVDWEKVPLNTAEFADEIATAASRYSVDESLIRAIIHAESAYQADAQSPKGAQGLMQLMPAMQKELQVENPFDPESNIEGGTYHLSQVLHQNDGDIELAAAAYNAGQGAVQKWAGVPPYEETREYVRRIQILYRRYQRADS